MENTKLELPTIIDDAPVAEIEWLPAYYNTVNDNNYKILENVVNEEFIDNSINSTENIQMRTIIDNNPIAEWRPSPFSNSENTYEENNKIFPFEIEDFRKLYNIKRFPERIRRKPRVLKKYNELANYAVVTIFFLFKADTIANKKPRSLYHAKADPRPRLTYYAKLAHEIIDAPINSLKAKISQIDRWDYMDENHQLSLGLIKAYYDLANVNLEMLWNIINNHNKLDALEEIKKLINKGKTC